MNIKKCLNFVRKLSPYNIQKGLRYLKHFGLKEFLIRLSDRIEPEDVPYGPWYEAHKASEKELDAQRKTVFNRQPRISIAVPLYRTPERFLREMIESVRSQTYGNWELCLADGSGASAGCRAVLEEYAALDSRIRVKYLKKNQGIAGNTNEALAMAGGDYIGLLDHDDLLAPDALYEIVKRLQDGTQP